jgi:hypothetical protein
MQNLHNVRSAKLIGAAPDCYKEKTVPLVEAARALQALEG